MAVAGRFVSLVSLLFMVFAPLISCERYGLPSRTLHLYEDRSLERQKRQVQVFERPPVVEDEIARHDRDASRDRDRPKRSVSAEHNITTKVNKLNDSHQQLMVHWAGEGSDVILCLARDPTPVGIGFQSQPSAVFISYDYGESFVNKTDSFKLGSTSSQSQYASLDKFYSHPKFNTHTVFTDTANQMIFTTRDNGYNIVKTKLLFHPTDVTFHEEEPLTFLAYDKLDPSRKLWLTKDFGQSWTVVQEYVKAFFWSSRTDGQSTQLYVERETPSGTSTVLASSVLFQGERHQVVITGVEDFQVKGDFMFATKKLKKDSPDVDLFVSYRRGPFAKGVFQSELDRRDYHVADVEGSQVMVAVSHTDELANLYVSESMDENTVQFALSLERIFCYFPNATWKNTWLNGLSDESFADLHKVEGLKGIYIASQVSLNATSSNIHPDFLTTVMTYDRGGEWKPINPPMFDDEGQKINCNSGSGCSLHLSMKFNQLYPATRSVPILSSKSAPGIILATGIIGRSLKGHPGMFLSRDAGLTWRQILKDNFFFNFGDHGGLIAAVRYYKSRGETRELLYSTDEGEHWSRHTFYDDDLRVYGLMTEPGENTTIFTMFGSTQGHHQWLILKVDLINAFSRNCTNDDYKNWSPSSESGPYMPCLLGRKETFDRRIASANCYNGKDFDRPIKMEICECNAEDYECEFGFVRNAGVKNCIRDKTNKTEDPFGVPASCSPGSYYNRTKGYRRIPEDVCKGGYEQSYLPDRIPCPFMEKKEFLLVAQREKIARYDLVDKKFETLPVDGLRNVIAVEFDIRNNCVYWADIVNDTIARQCLSDGKGRRDILVSTNLSSIEGMALDWISNVLYFVDGMRGCIEVIRTDLNSQGRMRRTILGHDVLKKPRGIAVHPMRGYIFWTDWAPGDASVSRANADGTNVKRLFKKPLVEWPNGITIDHIAERIYWVDAREDYIGASDLEGRRFKKIIANDERVSHPFAVAVFKDNMYWDDWKQNAIFIADKDHGVGIQTLAGGLPMLMDLKMFAHSVQEGTNACSNLSRVGCTHLCLGMPKGGHVCLCPDGMTMKDGVCMCPTVAGGSPTPAFANGTCPQVAQSCTSEQFTCGNALCVSKQWRCDGDDDCGDNSDERGCRQSCPANLYQCEDGKCIPPYWKCDLDRDCENGEDEKNCNYTTCTKDQFQCDNRRCISSRWRCDLEDDCRDGSDEKNCSTASTSVTCRPGEFRCTSNAQCLPPTWRCDGESDCSDGSDERNCSTGACQSWQFACKNNHCIFRSWRCDGDDDCQDGEASDEKDCNATAATPVPAPPFLPTNSCNDWMFLCNNGKCVPYWWKCDGTLDCEDGSDEVGCGANTGPTSPGTTPSTKPPHAVTCLPYEFMCVSGECIADAWVCDGEKDCSGGEDEVHCPTKMTCGDNQLKCRMDGSCVPLSQVCDGRKQCPDGSDEEGCERPTGPTPATPSCQQGMFSCDIYKCLPLTMYCDGHEDCYDGMDEANCQRGSRVYQALAIGVDIHSITDTSLLLNWYMKSPKDVVFYYLPSIADTAPNSKWTNHTHWIKETELTFKLLNPFTTYNMTVYVKVNDTVYPPGKYVVATTAEGVPSAPSNVKAKQMDSNHVQVSWMAPVRPNGIITGYFVLYSPPLPPVQTAVSKNFLFTNIWVPFNASAMQNYTFWVFAKNSRATSASSEAAELVFDNASMVEPVQGLVADSRADSSVTLSWKPVAGAEGYQVTARASTPYPGVRTGNVTGNRVVFDKLSPGVNYLIAVSAFSKNYFSSASTISAQTTGTPLPVITNLLAQVLKTHGTTVKLHWDPPQDARKVKWQYGVYYALNMKELFKSSKLVTSDTNATVLSLDACEAYVFGVGVVGPLGLGPLSSPQIVMTSYNVSAPPKNVTATTDPLRDSVMLVSWNASCPAMKAVKYMVTVTELTLKKSSSMTLYPSNATGLSLAINTHYGGVYHVIVRSTAENAIPSRPVEYRAPAILPPHQIQVLPERNGSYIVYWQERDLPRAINNTAYKYKVLVSEGPSLNLSTAKEYEASKPPFILDHALGDGTTYSFAVILETADGYRSLMSEVNSVETPAPSWSAVISTSNLVSVVVPIVLVLIALMGALAIFVFRHRRLQRSFVSFANSHYDTRSGAATFSGGDGLVGDFEDEEDSPVIHGFSDDEPLVIA